MSVIGFKRFCIPTQQTQQLLLQISGISRKITQAVPSITVSFRKPVLACLRRRKKRINEEDSRRQTWII